MAYKKSNANGQATMANSEPVVLASDQSAIPVTVSGVATAANQTTIIGHVDGIEGLLTTIDADTGSILTAVQLLDDSVVVLGTATYTEATSSGLAIGAVRRDADTTLVNTTNEWGPLQMDANGRLKVEIFTGGETFAVLDTNSAAQLTALQLIDNAVSGAGFNITQFNGEAIDVGAGTEAAAIRVTLPTNGTGILAGVTTVTTVSTVTAMGAGTTGPMKAEDAAHATGDQGFAVWTVRQDTLATTAANGDYVPFSSDSIGALYTRDTASLVDDAAFTPATSRVIPIGLQADETATDSVDEGDIGAPRMTLDRKQIMAPQGHAAGGLTIFRSIDLDETEEEIKATAGTVYHMWVTNTSTGTRWVKFYNATAANVTVGSTTPVITIGIPGNSSDDVSGLFGGGIGIGFGTAITVAATTGVADADTGAPGANDVIINVFYA